MIKLRILLCLFIFIQCDIALAKVTWDGGGDGTSWDDPLNWDDDNLPDDDEDVDILNGDNVIIDSDLTTDPGKIKIEGGSSLEVQSGGVLITSDHIEATNGTFTVSGGSVTADGEIKAKDGGTVSLTGGSLSTTKLKAEGTGTLTASGTTITTDKIESKGTATMNLTGGVITVNGEIKAKDSGALNISTTVTGTDPTKHLKIEDGSNVTISEGANVSGFQDIEFDNNDGEAATLTVTGGSLEILGDIVADGEGDVINVSGGSITVPGDITVGDTDLDITISGGSITAGSVTDDPPPADPNDISDNISTSGSGFISAGGVTLPVELVRFSSTLADGSAVIDWETATELNNERFLLEKSADGQNFVEVASIKGGGTSSVLLRYQFTDKNLKEGIFFYRLSQFDFDGKSEILGVISLVNNVGIVNSNVMLFPNPISNNRLIASLTGKLVLEEWTATLIDLQGKVIQHKTGHAGQTVLSMDIPLDLISGTYLLRVQTRNELVTKRLLLD